MHDFENRKKLDKKDEFLKEIRVNENFDDLPDVEKALLKKSLNGVAFDNINEAGV